ncbi:hypothetical protein SAMN05216249_101174 [Acetitomaculum ruminis DSM 5522]|uniref:Radical SAM core domain-containing protein n=1 Tax=Acetitomaculum ruminis DSM 5522 TaxID=1120918 RepID=A0A1I0V5H9_9FIRM|nr:TIGR01212 family radical SAM protein [Acetitomaculum ruminis]SFA71594.1 hypothetical protein SAMN05216249_101174 [Acetitomaculum ruminis DSM 5522]
MNEKEIYYHYSDYLKEKYNTKVYKLPVNLPVGCPNRKDSQGCIFCAPVGTGFESLEENISVKNQLIKNRDYIGKRYKAKKFIAYFQNYTNTYLPFEQFKTYINEAMEVEDIVEISISTRPDCISKKILDFLLEVHNKGYEINIELGLQSVNYKTLQLINRGHGLGEFISAVLNIKKYPFTICTHMILNLPYDDITDVIEGANVLSSLPVDIIKLHSLYIAKNTILCEQYENGKIHLCSKDEYINRLGEFLSRLRPNICIERLFARAPERDVVFANWNSSWWKLKDEFVSYMCENQLKQGCNYEILNEKALKKAGF